MTKTSHTAAKPKMEVIKGLFAFWRYDQYPYVLGAEVTRMSCEGHVYAPSYQRWFDPIKMMPTQAGKALDARLQQLRAEHVAAHTLLDVTWNKTLFDLLPEARSPEHTYAGFPRKVDDKK